MMTVRELKQKLNELGQAADSSLVVLEIYNADGSLTYCPTEDSVEKAFYLPLTDNTGEIHITYVEQSVHAIALTALNNPIP